MADIGKITADIAEELSRCAELLVEAQDCIADLMPLIRNKRAITGIQRIDLATQMVVSLEHISRAVSQAVTTGQTLARDDVEGGPILQEITDRVWTADPPEPAKADAPDQGAIQWL